VTFEEAALLTRSEKVTLVTCQAEHLVKLFTLHSGSIYKRSVNHFVESVKVSGQAMTKVSSLGAVVSGTYYHDIKNKTIYLFCVGGVNPKTLEMSFTYKLFFSNAPLNLPYDLASGEVVEWLPYLTSIGSVGQQLDSESTGVVLESSSSIDFINTGFFDEIFDTFIFENKTVSFYSWFTETPVTEARRVFEGVIDSKDYGISSVKFNVKDFVFKLRDKVNLGVFTALDGTIQDSLIDTPKRRIYGQVKQVKTAGVSNILESFPLTGTATVLIATNTLAGVGTLFLSQVSVGDELIFTVESVVYKFGVESISSNTALVLNKVAETNIISQAIRNNPKIPYRFYNRSWHVAGHALRQPTTTITTVKANNRFIVASTEDIFAGDQVEINGDLVTVRRISGSEIVTQNAIAPTPSAGDTFIKLAIQNVFFGNRELIFNRDWTFINLAEAIITLEPLAEFNITQEKLAGVSITFTSSTSTLSTTATVDFRSILKPRDWIRKNSIISGENTWHEILDVKEQSIILRSNYTGTTATTTALIKAVDYIQDDSLITCNCLGFEDASGAWLKTPSDVVKHLVVNDAGFSSINAPSFEKAKADCDYVVSLVIPDTIGSEAPSIRDSITRINESVFGSLYGDSSLSISYSILNAEKPDTTKVLKDDDVLSWDTQSKTEIYNNVICSYRPFTDTQNGQDTFETVTYNSGFVDKYVGLKNTLERTLYLFESDKAEIIAQRLALFFSLASTTVTLKGKMLFYLNAVNDKIFINFDRLFKRFGGNDRRKIGIVTGIKKSQTEVEVTISDLGNIFNRVPAICPNTAQDFALAKNDDKVLFGYIVDNDTLTPDAASEDALACNIIG